MIVVILAAGIGKRIASYTKDGNKTLIQIGGKTILERMIRAYVKNGFNDFRVVIGYAWSTVEKELKRLKSILNFELDTIYNPNYRTMNNCYSLFLGIEELNNSILVSNSDIVFDPKILEYVTKSLKKNFLVIDTTKSLGDEDMKVYIEDDKIIDIGKTLDIKRARGEYIGISGIEEKSLPLLKQSLKKIVQKNPNLFYEDAYRLMLKEVEFYAIGTHSLKWAEIDTPEDLDYAKRLFKKCV